jgi:hypothetical protein
LDNLFLLLLSFSPSIVLSDTILFNNIANPKKKDSILPAPPSITAENTSNSKLGINNQKLILLSLGNLLQW